MLIFSLSLFFILEVHEVPAENLNYILDKAQDGDTIIVLGGYFKGNIQITKSVRILGKGEPVLDGGGKGSVVIVRSPSVISGFIIKGTGDSLLQEDSAVLIENTEKVTVENCRIYDALFGIYLKNSSGVVIKNNQIEGKEDIRVGEKGDGIRLWYSRDVLIEGNNVKNVRDVVIWYSTGVMVRRNKVYNSRYGLHYMYSDGNFLVENDFRGNVVGSFIMYSKNLLVERNIFGSSKELSGMGIGLKDASFLVIRNNLIVDNTVGIYFANSPEFMTLDKILQDLSDDDVLEGKSYGNVIRNNVIAYNSFGFRILPPSFPNLITSNTFLGNIMLIDYEQVPEDKNSWFFNYYDFYRGFDLDKDGIGDIPLEYYSSFLRVLVKFPELRFFYFSPLRFIIEQVIYIFPVLGLGTPIFSDPFPSVIPNFFGWKN